VFLPTGELFFSEGSDREVVC